jgi:subtilisin-like proprotein convertase family protein
MIQLRKLALALALALVVLALASPAMALDKQAAYGEMLALGEQIRQLKPQSADAGVAAQLAAAEARYAELSALLGGDDPASVRGDAPQAPTVAPAPPPGCTEIAVTGTNSTPLPIPDFPAPAVSSTITISGAGTYLLDVDLTTAITHTFNGDLDFTLTSPAGTVVVVSTDNGSTNDDVFNGTLWDDQANAPVHFAVFANLVVETPLTVESALGAFVGEDPNGTWTLTIGDDAGIDIGTLNSWSLDLATVAVAPPLEFSSGSNPTPLPIPDAPAPAVSSTITISGAGTYLTDVDLTTTITHTFNGDLEFTLTSPAGTIVLVSRNRGGGNDNVFNGTLWNDQASAPISEAVFANLVTETPLTVESALGAFVGEDPNGTWTLTIGDEAGIDTGTLSSWSLDFTTAGSCFQAPITQEIPTASTLGLAALALLLAGGAFVALRRG